MNTIFRICAVLSVFCLLLAAPACNSDPRAALYGKWQWGNLSDNQPVTWEFGADGSFTISAGENQIQATYTFIDDQTIQFEETQELAFGGKPITWSVSGDKLTLTLESESITLTRVR